jgi:hypothetical protein
MPPTDYTDPETPFPRLEVLARKTEENMYWLNIWLHEALGKERKVVLNGKRGGSWLDSHAIIEGTAAKHGAFVTPDDITME